MGVTHECVLTPCTYEWALAQVISHLARVLAFARQHRCYPVSANMNDYGNQVIQLGNQGGYLLAMSNVTVVR